MYAVMMTLAKAVPCIVLPEQQPLTQQLTACVVYV
jgi:hypothetical protein